MCLLTKKDNKINKLKSPISTYKVLIKDGKLLYTPYSFFNVEIGKHYKNISAYMNVDEIKDKLFENVMEYYEIGRGFYHSITDLNSIKKLYDYFKAKSCNVLLVKCTIPENSYYIESNVDLPKNEVASSEIIYDEIIEISTK